MELNSATSVGILVGQPVDPSEEMITFIQRIPIRMDKPNTPILAQFSGVRYVLPDGETHSTITMTVIETHYPTTTATKGGKDSDRDQGRDN